MTTVEVDDRQMELRAFDATKAGVKGLVDSGLTSLPRIFHVPPEEPIDAIPTAGAGSAQVPVIDLAGEHASVVEAVRRAAGEWGFFQVVGHGVPETMMEGVLQGARRFHEETEAAEKAAMYSRELGRKVVFVSNFKLFTSPVADWRDTLNCIMAPVPPEPEELPSVCREELIQYSKHMTQLGETLFQLLSQALYLDPNRLKELECNRGHALSCQYYPPCLEPERALGASRHSDPSFLTVLLQDQVGGLQVLHDGQWIDVQPIPGALVINIADLLQVISNGKFISVEHRVLANKHVPRSSVACFFGMYSPPFPACLYGPAHELLSDQNPPLYKQFSLGDYVASFAVKGHLARCALDVFKL